MESDESTVTELQILKNKNKKTIVWTENEKLVYFVSFINLSTQFIGKNVQQNKR